MYKAIWYLIFFLSCWSIHAQPVDSLKAAIPQVDSLEHSPTLSVARTTLSETDFNRGHLTHALQLVQGKTPSLLIARPGNDPNGYFDFRIRGIKSFDETTPLIVIDGLPGASLEVLHPEDIASVEILKGGADAALLGIRGSNGVLSIKTKRGETGKSRLNYHTYLAVEHLSGKPDLLDAGGFRSIGGFDLGGDTDWWDEITRTAVSQRHALSLSGGSANSTYYASLNFDGVNGIALRSAFQRLNGRLFFEQKALKDRLTVSGGLASAFRKSHLTPLEAFWQATSYNPTSPVVGNGPAFDQYGGYYELIRFRYYNPVSMLEQNEFVSERQNLTMQLNARLEITKNLTGVLQYGNQEDDLGARAFFPGTSFYVGANRNGLAQRTESKRSNDFFSGGLQVAHSWENAKFEATLTHYRQSFTFQQLSAEGGAFLTDVFSYHNLAAAADFSNGVGEVRSFLEQHKLSGFRGRFDLTIRDRYFFSANLSREGSSRLGANNRWGLFYGLGGGVHINDQWTVRSSYGKTGHLPSRRFPAQGVFREGDYYYYNGAFNRGYAQVREANPDLRWEETREWNIGLDLDLLNGRLRGSMDFYTSRSDDLIREIYLEVPPNLAGQAYRNVAAVRNSGLELDLHYQLFQQSSLQWRLGAAVGLYGDTRLLEYPFGGREEEFIGRFDAVVCCNTPVSRIKEGEPLGELWSPQLHPVKPVTDDGRWNIVDRSGDGYWWVEDYYRVGNALPDWTLGLSNQLIWGRWRIDLLLRGVFGHHLVNSISYFNSSPAIVDTYNVLSEARSQFRTLKEWARYTDRNVENASFLRLDNLTFSYDLEPKRGLERLQLYLTLQNLFTLTSYTGLDPEVRLVDREVSYLAEYQFLADPYQGRYDPMVPGIDRQRTFPPSRTFVMGVKIGL